MEPQRTAGLHQVASEFGVFGASYVYSQQDAFTCPDI